MGEMRTIVDTAWADIKTRYAAICTTNGQTVPVFDFGVHNVFSRTKYPAMLAVRDFTRQEPQSMLGEELQVNLTLVLVHTDSRPARLEETMMDYLDNVFELIRDDHTFGGACHIGEFVGSDSFAGSQDGPLLAIETVSLRLRKEVQI